MMQIWARQATKAFWRALSSWAVGLMKITSGRSGLAGRNQIWSPFSSLRCASIYQGSNGFVVHIDAGTVDARTTTRKDHNVHHCASLLSIFTWPLLLCTPKAFTALRPVKGCIQRTSRHGLSLLTGFGLHNCFADIGCTTSWSPYPMATMC